MSIRPTTVDRHGDRPCIPDFYVIAKRMAEGRVPSLTERISKALAQLRRRIGA